MVCSFSDPQQARAPLQGMDSPTGEDGAEEQPYSRKKGQQFALVTGGSAPPFIQYGSCSDFPGSVSPEAWSLGPPHTPASGTVTAQRSGRPAAAPRGLPSVATPPGEKAPRWVLLGGLPRLQMQPPGSVPLGGGGHGSFPAVLRDAGVSWPMGPPCAHDGPGGHQADGLWNGAPSAVSRGQLPTPICSSLGWTDSLHDQRKPRRGRSWGGAPSYCQPGLCPGLALAFPAGKEPRLWCLAPLGVVGRPAGSKADPPHCNPTGAVHGSHILLWPGLC